MSWVSICNSICHQKKSRLHILAQVGVSCSLCNSGDIAPRLLHKVLGLSVIERCQYIGNNSEKDNKNNSEASKSDLKGKGKKVYVPGLNSGGGVGIHNHSLQVFGYKYQIMKEATWGRTCLRSYNSGIMG